MSSPESSRLDRDNESSSHPDTAASQRPRSPLAIFDHNRDLGTYEIQGTEINLDLIAKKAYQFIRDEYQLTHSDDYIASQGYCIDASVFMTGKIGHYLYRTRQTDLRTATEPHSNDVGSHYITVIKPTDNEPSWQDAVICLTYKQHLNSDIASQLPNMYTGSRWEIYELMKHHATNPAYADLYAPCTISL